ncbi:MAG: hypothetical protein KDJ29_11015 [Hyphomicrobiales bacterium]|nr:hypothetical protein [Hyphomicrobiales bacterium]
MGTTGLYLFGWNPLYHITDQTRGYVFVNYTPHFTTLTYPIVATIVLVSLGLMGEFFTRRLVSASWWAKR